MHAVAVQQLNSVLRLGADIDTAVDQPLIHAKDIRHRRLPLGQGRQPRPHATARLSAASPNPNRREVKITT